jgi:hypothetical protein
MNQEREDEGRTDYGPAEAHWSSFELIALMATLLFMFACTVTGFVVILRGLWRILP